MTLIIEKLLDNRPEKLRKDTIGTSKFKQLELHVHCFHISLYLYILIFSC